jgi:hypothetical protein
MGFPMKSPFSHGFSHGFSPSLRDIFPFPSRGYLPFADELDDPTEVCTAVLQDPLELLKESEGWRGFDVLKHRKTMGKAMGKPSDFIGKPWGNP